MTAVVHPPTLNVLRAYLLDRSEVTDLVGTRISSTMTTPFPSLRIVETSTTEVTPRVWVRMLTQIDCWHTTQTDAARLARIVVAVLRDSANWTTAGAVMGETEDLVIRDEPDETLNPQQPRAIVTGHVWVRPA